ncbi:MAG: type VI secretion system tip protein VgrG [Bacteroidales bacterium]|nr:type VI secretion system tip protein VgrG [Bacteroidales bacterium]
MADTPIIEGESTVKITVYSEGTALDNKYRIISVLISKKLNKIPYAKISFADGDMPNGDFPLSNEDDFKPGNTIIIKAGYGQEEEKIFEGIVIKHGIKISGQNSSQLVVELKDKAVKMTVGRKNVNSIDTKDSDAISTIIGNYGLTADVDSTKTTYKQLVQYYATDWDFMMTRAEANGLIVIVDDGKVSVKAPDTSGSAVLKVSYGLDLMYFKADVEAEGQLSAAKSIGWSISDQKITEQDGEAPSLNKQGDLTDSDLSDVIGISDFQLQSATPDEETSFKSWADGQLLKSGLSKIIGTMKFQGNAKAKPGVIIELERLGNRFNGNVFLSSVQHVFSDGNWVTEADFGLKDELFSETKNIVAPAASGALPGIEGLHMAVVEKLDGDPDGEGRIQVKCPLLGDDADALWARLSNVYGLSEYGMFFIPEIGTEVIIGFFNNDPRFPVVLGSMHSSKNKSPYELTADNFTKAIVTKSKLKIEFDDDKKITNIETPGGNKIVISDDEKSILLSDQNKNKVQLNSDGIVLDSPKDIKITSKANVTIEGTGGVEIKSSADVKVTGMNISQTANASFTAKGTASAEFSASGNTTVKGAMVMIN